MRSPSWVTAALFTSTSGGPPSSARIAVKSAVTAAASATSAWTAAATAPSRRASCRSLRPGDDARRHVAARAHVEHETALARGERAERREHTQDARRAQRLAAGNLGREAPPRQPAARGGERVLLEAGERWRRGRDDERQLARVHACLRER